MKNRPRDSFQFVSEDYDVFWKKWNRCRDIFAGSDLVKELGDKYLPKSRWHKNGGADGKQDYDDYKARAVFFSYLKDAVETSLGVLKKGEPTIKLPPQIAFMEKSATVYHDGLTALKGKLDAVIMLTGCAGLSLEVNDQGSGNTERPDFFINIWQPESIKDKNFDHDELTGESYATLVLLDESEMVFDKNTKRRVLDTKWRVMGLDAIGQYYTALLKPEQYPDFDLDNPPVAADQRNPQLGEAVYPMYRGDTFRRIPFTFVNATDLSGGHYEDPPLYDLVDLVIALYRGDADYRQTLHFTASDFYKHTGCNDPAKQRKLSVGAGGILHLGGEEDIAVVSSPGGGANLQREALNNLHAQCQQRIMTLLDVGANQSGAALEIMQNSKSARIEPINQNTANAIEEQLRFAAEWTGMSREQAHKEVVFTAAKIEDTSLVISQLQSLWHSMTTENYPLTRRDFHTLQRKANMTQNDFDQNTEELEVERAALEAQGIKTGGYLPGEEPPPAQKTNQPRK